MTRKEVLEIIVEVANEANEYSPCWNVQKAARELLQMEDPEATQARIAELEQDSELLAYCLTDMGISRETLIEERARLNSVLDEEEEG